MGRLLALAWVLVRHGALIGLVDGPRHRARRHLLTALAAAPWRAARPGRRWAAALTRMGPSFVKLGQSLATRGDLLGAEIADDLAYLQDRMAPFPAAEARRALDSRTWPAVGQCVRRIRRHAGRRRLARPGPFRGHRRGRAGGGQNPAPWHRGGGRPRYRPLHLARRQRRILVGQRPRPAPVGRCQRSSPTASPRSWTFAWKPPPPRNWPITSPRTRGFTCMPSTGG